MKKILIVNQHTNNHGDEAAGIALIRELKKQYQNAEISVLYNWYEKLKEEAYIGKDEFKDIKHYSFSSSKLEGLLIRMSLYFPFLYSFFAFFSKTLSTQRNIIKSSDLVVNGPGGVNIGPYMDYHYLWRLFVVYKLKKELAIYSISFGPLKGLPEIFKKRSVEVLRYAQFLSLRDDKSHEFGKELDLGFYKSIDTAFLSKKEEPIPNEYKEALEKEYVVIVPNELYNWHPYFKSIDKNLMDKFYIEITNLFVSELNLNVVFLPQLFANQNDMDYMTRLKKSISSEKVHVIDSAYNSDVQQKIISKSNFVVGARYHTIIFSINNNVPFFALSYEHKMENMLSLLSLSDLKMDLISFFQSTNTDFNVILDSIKTKYLDRANSKPRIVKASEKSSEIAKDTFSEFTVNMF